MSTTHHRSPRTVTRRQFLRQSALGVAAASAVPAGYFRVLAAGSDELKVGLVGCGGRGSGAATQVLTASQTPVKLWAMADLFEDRLDASYRMLTEGAQGRYDRDAFQSLAARMDVPATRRFIGFEAYRHLLASGVDMVILATPPGFRADQFLAAVEAGKHVFMEKPVAVDPTGYRTVLRASQLARQKGLSVVAGTQRRHQAHYVDIIQRIHDGAIGEILGGQCYWHSGGSSLTLPQPANMSDMEWQCRRWYYFCWLCGDHIVEQHVHNIDVMNWALRAHPVSAMGQGGRQVRRGGNIWDHFFVEFEYENGVRISSSCQQIPAVPGRVAERIVGTKGVAYLDSRQGTIRGETRYRAGDSPNPYLQEHADWIDSIRHGHALNEGQAVAESTLAAVMGRNSAYTRKLVEWDWLARESQQDLRPPKLEFGPLPVAPVPQPGTTRLI